MGRFSTGAITTGEAFRIELSYLLKKGDIQKGCIVKGIIAWNNGSIISFESCYQEEKYIRLYYTLTKPTGEEYKLDYKIQLTTIPSNLGRGEIPYFVCPISGKRARILYRAYGSLYFQSRQAYRKRIYYACQKCQKNFYDTERYFELEKQLEALPEGRKSHYRGKATRHQQRIRKLYERLDYHDMKRWRILASYMARKYPAESG